MSDLRGLIAKTVQFTLRDRAADLTCPVLLTRAENDAVAADVGDFAAALADVTILGFTAAEGAGAHCEMMNRSLVNRRCLDWLDGVFGV